MAARKEDVERCLRAVRGLKTERAKATLSHSQLLA
jgi:hypothetical protein